ncbi:hypothetical protein [Microcoleus sp. CAWBG58]|uniref:hypothetical protein n=1 Tax=Microcoleus sp. CAWBG58 TaxID=2841651 RepID=UPI0025F8D8BB|nr:hypothetical protein [Microcoleus sp. CAWBG58]
MRNLSVGAIANLPTFKTSIYSNHHIGIDRNKLINKTEYPSSINGLITLLYNCQLSTVNCQLLYIVQLNR